jgi:hypothetical protein
MDRFIPSESIKHFRDWLRSECDPPTRLHSERPVVGEEDKLGADPERLPEAEAATANFDALVDTQGVPGAAQELDGHCGLTQSQMQTSGDVQPLASVDPALIGAQSCRGAAPTSGPTGVDSH